jgi:hypothetical protein
MDIVKQLSIANSKPNSLKIASYIGDDAKKLDLLMNIIFGDDFEQAQRASWAMVFVYEHHPYLFKKYHESLIKLLKRDDCHDAVHRNGSKILETETLDEDMQSLVWDIGIMRLKSMQTSIAVKAYLMTVLAKIAIEYNELSQELISIIELQYPYSSAGFKSRAKKVFKMLGKQIRD